MIFAPARRYQPGTPPAPSGFGPGTAWTLVRDWAPDASRQMALDQALAEAVWAGRRPPTVRLYGWHRPALTIGRLQRADGLPCPAVRRWTGGRAVFHEDELTVALALPAGHPWIARTVAATYANTAAPLLAALAALGLAATPPEGAARSGYAGRFGCFSCPTPMEAAVAGHKVLAQALRLGPGGLLAQASIPLNPPSAFGPAAARAAVGLAHFLPNLTREALAGAVAAAFQAALAAAPADAPPTRAERRRAEDLALGPYAPIFGP